MAATGSVPYGGMVDVRGAREEGVFIREMLIEAHRKLVIVGRLLEYEIVSVGPIRPVRLVRRRILVENRPERQNSAALEVGPGSSG